MKEECGLDVIAMDKIGIIEFEYVGSNELLEGHIYLCNLFSGDIIESDGCKQIIIMIFISIKCVNNYRNGTNKMVRNRRHSL